MSNLINPTYRKYQVSNSGISQDGIQDTLNKSKTVVSDNFESNSAVQNVSGNFTDPSNMQKTMLLLPPLMIIDRFVDSLMGGGENSSILKKAANVGDKISHALHLDKVISENTNSKFSNFIKNNSFTKYFTKEYQAIPKSSFAKSQSMAEKYSGELLSNLTDLKYNFNFSELFSKANGSLSDNSLKFFENIGPLKNAVTRDYLSSLLPALEELSTTATEEVDKAAIEKLENEIIVFIQKSGDGNTKNLSEKIASVLSKFTNTQNLSEETKKILSSVSTNTQNAVKPTAEQLINIADDVVAQGVDTVKAGSMLSDPVHLTTLRNKLKASTSKLGNTTLGQTFAKGTLKTKDTITYGGGLISLMFTASALIQATKAAKEAPKGEKKSTFMHVLSEQYLGILLFQPSINLMYKIGGNKYRGMSVEAREALKTLVTKTNADETLTKEGLKVAKLQRDLLIKGVDKDKVSDLAGKTFSEAKAAAKNLKGEGAKLKFWEKPLKFIGKILDTGLDKMQIPKFKEVPVLGKIKIPQPTLRGFAGGLARFAIIMMVLQPLLQKPVTKLCHKIFGTPTTYLKKQEEKDKKSSKNNTNVENVNTQTSTQPALNSSTNLINKWTQLPTDNAVNQDNNTVNQENNSVSTTPIKNSENDEIAALNLFKNKNEKVSSNSFDDSNLYVPSIEPPQFEDNEAQIQKQVNEILKNTEYAMKSAKEVI
jgi:hypothetical protein